MNILTIEPNLVKKTARITGKVAVGELVDVVIDDVSEINSESLRLRVFCAGRVIAQYPAPGKAESFGEDGDDLTCSMRFDSVEARRMCIGRETQVLLVLEDIGDNAQLYFTQEWSLKGWPGIDTDEKPSDFSVYAFPTLVTKWTKELEDAKSAYDSHAGSKNNPHEVTKYQVGLGRVDNTSDSEKPVSVATASAIDAEKRRAESMESNLLETVKSETAARISGDDGLKRLVEAEKTRAMNAEAAVSAEAAGALSAESERAFAEESRIANLVGIETERAMSAEKGNDDAIEAEAARAKEKESQIEGMVDAERERATAREDELRYALTHESAYLKSLIAALDAVRFEVVSELPVEGEGNVIYLVPNGGTGTNIKDEYLWVDGNWEKIGTTDVDLSEYLKAKDAVTSVNGMKGDLSLAAVDVGALPSTVDEQGVHSVSPTVNLKRATVGEGNVSTGGTDGGALAVGRHARCLAENSMAGGHRSMTADGGKYGFAFGNRCYSATGAVAIGYQAWAAKTGNFANDDTDEIVGLSGKSKYTFIWQGKNDLDPGYYHAHGDGTFNINPVGGFNGVWVGEYALPQVVESNKRYLLVNPYPRTSTRDDDVVQYEYYVNDFAVNTIYASTDNPIVIHLPAPAVDLGGNPACRDFIVKINVTAENPPSITFVKHSSDTDIGFDAVDESWATLEPGTNYFSFTESER